MQYRTITPADQRAMLTERLRSLELDHYGHTLNLAALDLVPDSDPSKAEAVAETRAALDTISAAAQLAGGELDALPAPDVDGAQVDAGATP